MKTEKSCNGSKGNNFSYIVGDRVRVRMLETDVRKFHVKNPICLRPYTISEVVCLGSARGYIMKECNGIIPLANIVGLWKETET